MRRESYECKTKNWLYLPLNSTDVLFATEQHEKHLNTGREWDRFYVSKLLNSNLDTEMYRHIYETDSLEKLRDFTKNYIGEELFNKYWGKDL